MTPADYLPALTPELLNHKRPRLPYGDSERGQPVDFYSL